MKRWIGILLFTLTATLCISFFTACGEEYSEGLNFVLMEDGTYGVRCGKVTAEEIVIPSERFGIPVTKILDGFFIRANTKTELYGYDTHKVTVKLPESVTEIGDGAFYNCTVDCTVMLSASVKQIGKKAFASSSVDVVIPADSKLETIGENAFTKCGITEFTAPATLRSIESGAFYACEKLTWADLSLATELKKIPTDCFKYSALKGIILPKSVKSIDNSAFAYCYKLKTVDIPLDGELEAIGEYAFESCVLIKSFKFSQNLKNLEAEAFYNCNGLVEVYVPVSSKVATKVNNAHLGIGGYGILFVRTDMEAQSRVKRTDDGFLYIDWNGVLRLMGYDGDETEITLPNTLEGKKYTVGPYAFYNSDVTHVTLSNGVTGIGDSAFEGSYLEWINIPESVARIGKNVFSYLNSNYTLCQIVFEGEDDWNVGGNIVSSKYAELYVKREYSEFEWIRR